MRNSEHTDVGVGVEANNRAQLEEVAQNADLYIANQEANINILTCNMQPYPRRIHIVECSWAWAFLKSSYVVVGK